MTIIQALQNHSVRLSYANRWLVAGDQEGEWFVYERKPYAKKTIVVAICTDEEEAVDKLLSG